MSPAARGNALTAAATAARLARLSIAPVRSPVVDDQERAPGGAADRARCESWRAGRRGRDVAYTITGGRSTTGETNQVEPAQVSNSIVASVKLATISPAPILAAVSPGHHLGTTMARMAKTTNNTPSHGLATDARTHTAA